MSVCPSSSWAAVACTVRAVRQSVGVNRRVVCIPGSASASTVRPASGVRVTITGPVGSVASRTVYGRVWVGSASSSARTRGPGSAGTGVLGSASRTRAGVSSSVTATLRAATLTMA